MIESIIGVAVGFLLTAGVAVWCGFVFVRTIMKDFE